MSCRGDEIDTAMSIPGKWILICKPTTMDSNTALNEDLDVVINIHRLCREYNYPLLGIYATCASSRLTEILDKNVSITTKLERK